MKDFLYCSVFEYLKIDQHSIIIYSHDAKVIIRFYKSVFHKNKIFHCFHFEIFKKPSSLRSRKFVEKELIGEQWYFILAPKNEVTNSLFS